MQRLTPSQIISSYIIGLVIAVYIGHVATKQVVDIMWEYLNTKHPRSKKLERYHGQGEIVGLVERSLFFASLIANQPLFIGLWLTLKTVSQSPRWGRDLGNIQGRAVFQPFLAGTGLSLLFALGGYAITYVLIDQNPNSYLIVFGILLALLFIWSSSKYVAQEAIVTLKKEKEINKKRRRKSKK